MKKALFNLHTIQLLADFRYLKCPKILFRVIVLDQPLPSREAKAAATIIYIFFEGILALFLQTLEYALSASSRPTYHNFTRSNKRKANL